MTDNPEVVANNDVIMSTCSQSMNWDASQGRIKILTAKVNKLEEENKQLKTLKIELIRKIAETQDECHKKVDFEREKTRSLEEFHAKQIKDNERKIYDLQEMIKSFQTGRSSANRIEFAADLLTKKRNVSALPKGIPLSLTQEKMNEFFAPLKVAAVRPQENHCSSDAVLVPDTQNLNSSQSLIKGQTNDHFKHPSILSKVSPNSPSQIASTQMQTYCESLQMQDISTSIATNSQPLSQSQNPKWESIKIDLQNKFHTNCRILDSCETNQKLSVFPNDWVRDEVISWSQYLSQESPDCEITCAQFKNFNFDQLI
jgi:hypothetical protein